MKDGFHVEEKGLIPCSTPEHPLMGGGLAGEGPLHALPGRCRTTGDLGVGGLPTHTREMLTMKREVGEIRDKAQGGLVPFSMALLMSSTALPRKPANWRLAGG